MASKIYNLWGLVFVSRLGFASDFGFKGSVWASRFGAGAKFKIELRFGNISLRFMVYGCFIAFRLLLHEPLVLEGSQMLAQVSP